MRRAAADQPAADPRSRHAAGADRGIGAAAAPAAPAAPRFREVTLPAGTTLRLRLQSAVASDTSSVEDTVRAALRQAVSVDGAHGAAGGHRGRRQRDRRRAVGTREGRARVAYRFNSLTHDGERYDIVTAPLSHQAEATKGEDATKIAIGAGAGAAVGALLGGGDGAAKGAAIGGAGGTGVVLATRGEEVRLGPGADRDDAADGSADGADRELGRHLILVLPHSAALARQLLDQRAERTRFTGAHVRDAGLDAAATAAPPARSVRSAVWDGPAASMRVTGIDGSMAAPAASATVSFQRASSDAARVR